MNQLYYCDNLEALQKLPSKYVDLIYADPPFNSGRNYKTEAGSFNDKWAWDEDSDIFRDIIRKKAPECPVAFRINRALDSYDILFGQAIKGEDGSLRAYLAFIGIRLLKLHRILKPTGSIYLHCDSTASHYIKLLIDSAFELENFQNEIVWAYRKIGKVTKWFQRTHDIILQYSKGPDWIWNQLYESKSESTLKRFGPNKLKHIKDENGKRKNKITNEIADGTPLRNIWEIGIIADSSKERVGYPTQKPLTLLERIIEASSNEGDIVLDPFIGSGTTIDAAQKLNRNWIGIDKEAASIETTTKRLAEKYDILPKIDYEIRGTTQQIIHSLKLPTKNDIGPVQVSLF